MKIFKMCLIVSVAVAILYVVDPSLGDISFEKTKSNAAIILQPIENYIKSDTSNLNGLEHYKNSLDTFSSLAKYKKKYSADWQGFSRMLDSAITRADSIKAYNDSVEQANLKSMKPKTNSGFSSQQEEILAYLNGNEVKKEQLESYRKKAETQTLKKTIGLYLELWELDGENKTYKDLLSEVKKDANYKSGHIKNSKFVKFLEKESKNEDTKYNKRNAGKFN